jgi:hypothetical protein
MNKIEIRFLWGLMRFKRNVPESYGELTGKQFYEYIQFQMEKTKLNRFLSGYFKIPYRLFFFLEDYWIYRLSGLADFLAEMRIPQNRFFIENMPGTKLLAPERRLADVSLFQFMYVDRQFMDYINDENPEALIRLTAGIYKPGNISFDKLNMEHNIRIVRKRSSKAFLMATFINWTMIRTWLSSAYPFLFPMADEPEEDEKPVKNRKKAASHNWMDIFDAFVGGGVPDTEYYKTMPCIDAFRLINKRIKEYHDAKRKIR